MHSAERGTRGSVGRPRWWRRGEGLGMISMWGMHIESADGIG